MEMTPVFNHDLLLCIREACEESEEGVVSIHELKRRYLPKPQSGVIQGIAVMFEKDIDVLHSIGYVEILGENIKFISC